MQLRSVSTADVKNKTVILRVVLDVHFRNEKGGKVIEDDTRVRSIVPSVESLASRGAKVLLMSWLQRPEGKPNPEMSLRPVGLRLAELLGKPVRFVEDCVGPAVAAAAADMKPGDVALLENVRFHPGEAGEKVYDEAYARQLSEHADLFVNDAFGQSHRKVASIIGIPKFIPAYAGPELEKEVSELSRVLETPQRPFAAIIGGAKISTKLGVIKSLMEKADNILLGGALANTILLAQGLQVGTSLIEESMITEAKSLNLTDTRLHIPVDVITAQDVEAGRPVSTRAVGNVQANEKILDIGPDTIRLFKQVIGQAQTIVWNGPMGWFELPQFAKGTNEIAQALAACDARTVVGGGETISSIQQQGLGDRMTFMSMGGGAMLKFLEKGTLAGIEPLVAR